MGCRVGTHGLQPGKDFAAWIGGDADAIEKEVIRRCSPRTHPKIVKLAVKDVLESRKPRW